MVAMGCQPEKVDERGETLGRKKPPPHTHFHVDFMAFEVSYPGSPVVERCVVRALAARGLRRGTAADPDCVVQWVPYTKIAWCRALDPRHGGLPLLVSSFPIRTAIVRKDALAGVMRRLFDTAHSSHPTDVVVREAYAASFIVDVSRSDVVTQVAESLTELQVPGGAAWVIKLPSSNNATGITFAEGTSGLLSALASIATSTSIAAGPHDSGAFRESDGSAAPLIPASLMATDGLGPPDAPASPHVVSVQRYVSTPLLAEGRKAHVRLNVLCVGGRAGGAPLQVFVHRDPVVHVASEPWRPHDWGDVFVHVTNHCVQRAHPAFRSEAQTLSLVEYLRQAAPGSTPASAPSFPCADLAFARMCAVVARLFELVVHGPKGVPVTRVDGDAESIAGRSRAGDEKAAEAASISVPAVKSSLSGFVPAANAFEVFGFDFLFSAATVASEGPQAAAPPFPVLLEVNAGPALEGLADPAICRRVVEDVLLQAVDPWLVENRPAVAAARRARHAALRGRADSGAASESGEASDGTATDEENDGTREEGARAPEVPPAAAVVLCRACGQGACQEEQRLLSICSELDALPRPMGYDGRPVVGRGKSSRFPPSELKNSGPGFHLVWSAGKFDARTSPMRTACTTCK